MTLGIKVGLQSSSIADLEASRAPFCEVWFDINRASEYVPLFEYLKSHSIKSGLHFWGVLENNIWSNLAHPDLAVQSSQLIRQTIDIASKNHFVYVNVHPGSAAKVRLTMPDFDYKVISKPVDMQLSNECFLKYAQDLDFYAKSKNVLFTVETVPARVTDSENTRKPKQLQESMNIYELPLISMKRASEKGIAIANDFGHTVSSTITTNREEIWENLYEFTKQTAPKTKLIHLGFIVPPYNGSDYHDHLDNKLFETDDAIPNNLQMKKLLQLFNNRNDIWVLVEPANRHVENYFLAKKLLDEAGVN